jgi:hypothetical protein
MLENVSEGDGIKGVILQLVPELSGIEVADHHPFGPLLCFGRRITVQFNPDDTASPVHERFGEVPGGASDFQDAFVVSDQVQSGGMRVLLGLRIHRRVVDECQANPPPVARCSDDSESGR